MPNDYTTPDPALGSRGLGEAGTTADVLELTRRAFAFGGGGDYDAMMSFFGLDSVWDVSPWGLGTYTGLGEIRFFFESWIGALDGWAVEVEELHGLDNGVVVVIASQSGRPAGGGAPLQLRHASVLVWSDGVIERATNYRDIGEARTAAERLARERG